MTNISPFPGQIISVTLKQRYCYAPMIKAIRIVTDLLKYMTGAAQYKVKYELWKQPQQLYNR
jgi:hypothetical protein